MPKTTSKKEQSLETKLWKAADKLRGNLEPSEYKHVALGLIFLKYVSDAFENRRVELMGAITDPESADYIEKLARRERILESRDEYSGQNVFWIPGPARCESREAEKIHHNSDSTFTGIA